MNFKKKVCAFLLVTFNFTFSSPLAFSHPVNISEDSLYYFLENVKDVKASYEYPSMDIFSNVNSGAKLSAHTPIIIRCTETISTKEIVSGGTVNFAVVSDVVDRNGLVLVKAGTPVTAQISFAKSNGLIGRSGELTITDFHTTAIDGSYVPLASSVSAKPDDKMTLSIVLSVLICPLFLLIKGNDANVPVGTTKTAYTISDIYVKTSKI